MIVAQKMRLPSPGSKPPEVPVAVLVIDEQELWDCVGDKSKRIQDESTILYAMRTVYWAADEILKGKPGEPLIRRVSMLAGLSEDSRFQRLIQAMLTGVGSGDPNGVLAAQLTSLCAVLMMSHHQTLWPRDWEAPTYRRPSVWGCSQVTAGHTEQRLPRRGRRAQRAG
ncbi:MAG TPA: hypothetical protein VKM94_07140 [Blastocatellia bacterium]|nr:hypothetical protein [Blastocatellia bacterium]